MAQSLRRQDIGNQLVAANAGHTGTCWENIVAPSISTKRKPAQSPVHKRYERLLAAAKALPRLKVAVAHPCDEASLGAVIDAAALGLIEPILVGPPAKITDAATKLDADISGFRLVAAAHSHDAAEKAVALVRAGEAEALMKGSLHTDELIGAAVSKESGLRTARRISHCFVMDVPNHDTPLIVTDAAINISPILEDKRDIVQNAIDLAHALKVENVRVAVLSAMETISSKVPSTIEAAALSKMADRGQLTGAVLDGPLALDNAIDMGAAKIKKIRSPVAGKANILVVPDLEAGNILAKSLTFLAGADAAGIVLGARVPIILTSRADSRTSRLASCAVASLMAEARRSASVTQKA
jgi:phosphate acetyltransferase